MQEHGTDEDTKRHVDEQFQTDSTIEEIREGVDNDRSKEPADDQEDRDGEVLDAEKDRVLDGILQGVFKNRKKCESVKEDLDDQKYHDPDRILKEREAVTDHVSKIDKIQFISEESAQGQNAEPEEKSLLEAVLELPEICGVHLRIVTAYHLDTYFI